MNCIDCKESVDFLYPDKCCESCTVYSRFNQSHVFIMRDCGVPQHRIDALSESGKSVCYGCGNQVNWLAPDSRCKDCTRYTPEEIRGDIPC